MLVGERRNNGNRNIGTSGNGNYIDWGNEDENLQRAIAESLRQQ